VKRALSASAAETIVLASPEKLNAVSPYLVAPIGEITGMIVAASTRRKTLAAFERAGVAITKAGDH